MSNIKDSINKDLYTKIKSSLTEQDKALTSEWKKEINVEGEKYTLTKIKKQNIFHLNGNSIKDILFFGTTTFRDSNGETYTPISALDARQYVKKQVSKDFMLDSKSLSKEEIYEICAKGENKTIDIKYSPFLIELDKNIFQQKNLKGELDNLNIEDLSIFYLEYFPSLANNNQDSKYVNSEDRQLFFNEIEKKIQSGEKLILKPIELYGPFGIGKSCSLLAFQKAKLFGKSAYFNLHTLFDLKDNDKVKKMILYESMSLFDEFLIFSILKDSVNKKEFDNPWDIIKEVINFVFKNTNQMFVIILDQFKEIPENSVVRSSEKLDSILNNGDFGITIIKCSSMNDTDVKTNLFKSFGSDKYIYVDKLFEIKSLDEREKLYFGNISLFHYLYISSKKEFDVFIKEEKKIIKSDIRKSIPESTNLLKVISDISNIMKTNSLYLEEDIKIMSKTIPLKYILLKKNLVGEKIYYSFDYPCLLIRIIFEELAVEELNKLKETKGIKELKGTLGEIFEIICHFAILANKIEDFNLNSEKLFYLEKNIYNNQEKEGNWKKNEKDAEKMKNLDSFYIRPTNTNSELYDSIIIFKKDEKFYGYLLQMSISKDHGKKIVSREKHYEAIAKVKKKIKEIYDIKLENVYFSYIFNYDDIKVDDIIECNSCQLDYFYFSMENNIFYQLDIDQKTKPKSKKNENSGLKILDDEKYTSFPLTKLDFNSLSNMNEKKINTKFIKSINDLENDKYNFLEVMNKKRYYEYISNILEDLETIKKYIKKNKDLKLEIYCNSGNINKVWNYLKNEEYVCIIKTNKGKIYMLYNMACYSYDAKKKQFELKRDELGTLLFIEQINVEYEVFSII